MFTKIRNFLRDLFDSSPFQADQPYSPAPPHEQDIENNLPTGNYSEKNLEIEIVSGTNIAFGKTDEIAIDENNNVQHINKKQAHILGTGRLITRLEPSVKDGIPLPGVGGICGNCQNEALVMLQMGLISIQEAERRSLFDTDSGAQCQACGRKDLCIRHCRPFADINGQAINLCPECAQAAKREKLFKTSVAILISPIVDRKQLPPSQEDSK